MKRLLPIAGLTTALLIAVALSVQAQSTSFDLSWHAITGGGGLSDNAEYHLVGAVGQPVAGIPQSSTDGQFSLASGFLSYLKPVALSVQAQSTGFDLSWNAITGGGSLSDNAEHNLVGAAGQPVAGVPQPSSDGQFSLASGFWSYLNPVPSITAMAPESATEGDPAFELTVRGSKFLTGSTVLWEGSLRPTTFVSSAQLTASITEEDIASAGGDIATAQVTVSNSPPGGGLSVPASFAIVSADVSEVDSNTAGPGSDASSSTAPDAAGEAGVSATLTNNTDGSDPATVTAANYESDPNQTGVFDVGGGYVDLQVNGADASDTLDASFYYSSTITGQTEADLRLLYYTGAAWKGVLSNGGDFPTKDTPDNLDGTISGGRFSVTFDDTSTPTITGLSLLGVRGFGQFWVREIGVKKLLV